MFPENELKVYYPYGGKHFILRWHSYNEGHHIVLTKDKSTAENIFAKVLEKYYAEVKDFLQVDIVAPSEEQCIKYAEDSLNHNIDSFWLHYSYIARDYKKKNGSLPPKLKECTSYISKYGNTEISDLDLEYHFGCANCYEMVTPATGTTKEIYLANREEYLRQHPPYIDKKAIKSRAEKPDTSKPIRVIIPSFGHHCTGVDFTDIIGLTQFLFFFQNEVEVDRTVVDSMVKNANDAADKLKKDRSMKYDQELKMREENSFKDLLSIFG